MRKSTILMLIGLFAFSLTQRVEANPPDNPIQTIQCDVGQSDVNYEFQSVQFDAYEYATLIQPSAIDVPTIEAPKPFATKLTKRNPNESLRYLRNSDKRSTSNRFRHTGHQK